MPQINFDVLFQLIYDLLTGGWDNLTVVWPGLPKFVFWYKLGSYIFTIFGAVCAAYLTTKTLKIRTKERADLRDSAMKAMEKKTEHPANSRWQAIKEKLHSDNQVDWQWAIVEADKILDEVVKQKGYPGENLGEQLKAADPAGFLTLNEAWEAHKVRNQIAHEPGFQLDKRKAAFTISQFERVFKEFDSI